MGETVARGLKWVLLGLLAYGVFLALRWPAAQLVRPLESALPGMAARGLSGTAVSGEAARLVWRGTDLGRLQWRFDPASLLRARLGWRLRLSDPPDQMLRGRLQTGWHQPVVLHSVTGSLPLARLQNLIPLSLQGRLSLDLDRVRLAPGGRILTATGTVELNDVRLNALPHQRLGPFQARLQTRQGRVTALLRDRGGPLRLHASLQLRPDGSYRVTGTLDARGGAPTPVLRLIQRLGGNSDGHLRLDLSGRRR